MFFFFSFASVNSIKNKPEFSPHITLESSLYLILADFLLLKQIQGGYFLPFPALGNTFKHSLFSTKIPFRILLFTLFLLRFFQSFEVLWNIFIVVFFLLKKTIFFFVILEKCDLRGLKLFNIPSYSWAFQCLIRSIKLIFTFILHINFLFFGYVHFFIIHQIFSKVFIWSNLDKNQIFHQSWKNEETRNLDKTFPKIE